MAIDKGLKQAMINAEDDGMYYNGTFGAHNVDRKSVV